MTKKLNCKPGNKQCGQRCLPKGYECRVKSPGFAAQIRRSASNTVGRDGFGKKALGIAAIAGLGLAAKNVADDIKKVDPDFSAIRELPNNIPDEAALKKYDTFQPGDLIRKNFLSNGITSQHYGIYIGKEDGRHVMVDTGIGEEPGQPVVVKKAFMDEAPLLLSPNARGTEYEVVPTEKMYRHSDGKPKKSRDEIVAQAEALVGQNYDFSWAKSNCESFARGVVEGNAYTTQGERLSFTTNVLGSAMQKAYYWKNKIRRSDWKTAKKIVEMLELDYFASLQSQSPATVKQDSEPARAPQSELFRFALDGDRLKTPERFAGEVRKILETYPGNLRDRLAVEYYKAYLMVHLTTLMKNAESAQERSDGQKGIPCGKSYISSKYECRVGKQVSLKSPGKQKSVPKGGAKRKNDFNTNPDTGKPYTIRELKGEARKYEIHGYSDMTKDELTQALVVAADTSPEQQERIGRTFIKGILRDRGPTQKAIKASGLTGQSRKNAQEAARVWRNLTTVAKFAGTQPAAWGTAAVGAYLFGQGMKTYERAKENYRSHFKESAVDAEELAKTMGRAPKEGSSGRENMKIGEKGKVVSSGSTSNITFVVSPTKEGAGKSGAMEAIEEIQSWGGGEDGGDKWMSKHFFVPFDTRESGHSEKGNDVTRAVNSLGDYAENLRRGKDQDAVELAAQIYAYGIQKKEDSPVRKLEDKLNTQAGRVANSEIELKRTNGEAGEVSRAIANYTMSATDPNVSIPEKFRGKSLGDLQIAKAELEERLEQQTELLRREKKRQKQLRESYKRLVQNGQLEYANLNKNFNVLAHGQGGQTAKTAMEYLARMQIPGERSGKDILEQVNLASMATPHFGFTEPKAGSQRNVVPSQDIISTLPVFGEGSRSQWIASIKGREMKDFLADKNFREVMRNSFGFYRGSQNEVTRKKRGDSLRFDGQISCKKGKPCGDICIPKRHECRQGKQPSPRPLSAKAPDVKKVAVKAGTIIGATVAATGVGSAIALGGLVGSYRARLSKGAREVNEIAKTIEPEMDENQDFAVIGIPGMTYKDDVSDDYFEYIPRQFGEKLSSRGGEDFKAIGVDATSSVVVDLPTPEKYDLVTTVKDAGGLVANRLIRGGSKASMDMAANAIAYGDKYPDKMVVLTGFSMGGFDVREAQEYIRIARPEMENRLISFTFGSPKVPGINHEFGESHEITSDNDEMVSHFTFGKTKKFNSVDNHSMMDYTENPEVKSFVQDRLYKRLEELRRNTRGDSLRSDGQISCKKGKPCGDICIPKRHECRQGKQQKMKTLGKASKRYASRMSPEGRRRVLQAAGIATLGTAAMYYYAMKKGTEYGVGKVTDERDREIRAYNEVQEERNKNYLPRTMNMMGALQFDQLQEGIGKDYDPDKLLDENLATFLNKKRDKSQTQQISDELLKDIMGGKIRESYALDSAYEMISNTSDDPETKKVLEGRRRLLHSSMIDEAINEYMNAKLENLTKSEDGGDIEGDRPGGVMTPHYYRIIAASNHATQKQLYSPNRHQQFFIGEAKANLGEAKKEEYMGDVRSKLNELYNRPDDDTQRGKQDSLRADGQISCKKGKPCGDVCIPKRYECRQGKRQQKVKVPPRRKHGVGKKIAVSSALAIAGVSGLSAAGYAKAISDYRSHFDDNAKEVAKMATEIQPKAKGKQKVVLIGVGGMAYTDSPDTISGERMVLVGKKAFSENNGNDFKSVPIDNTASSVPIRESHPGKDYVGGAKDVAELYLRRFKNGGSESAKKIAANAIAYGEAYPDKVIVMTGHSMGGFDVHEAQEYIRRVKPELEDRILTFAIGTEHLGATEKFGESHTLGSPNDFFTQWLPTRDKVDFSSVEGHSLSNYARNEDVQKFVREKIYSKLEEVQKKYAPPPLPPKRQKKQKQKKQKPPQSQLENPQQQKNDSLRADGQISCKKGKPCGEVCIPKRHECQQGKRQKRQTPVQRKKKKGFNPWKAYRKLVHKHPRAVPLGLVMAPAGGLIAFKAMLPRMAYGDRYREYDANKEEFLTAADRIKNDNEIGKKEIKENRKRMAEVRQSEISNIHDFYNGMREKHGKEQWRVDELNNREVQDLRGTGYKYGIPEAGLRSEERKRETLDEMVDEYKKWIDYRDKEYQKIKTFRNLFEETNFYEVDLHAKHEATNVDFQQSLIQTDVDSFKKRMKKIEEEQWSPEDKRPGQESWEEWEKRTKPRPTIDPEDLKGTEFYEDIKTLLEDIETLLEDTGTSSDFSDVFGRSPFERDRSTDAFRNQQDVPEKPDKRSMDLVGISEGMNPQEAKKAWHKAVAKWHPDRLGREATQEQLDEYTRKTQEINAAYNTYLNWYDLFGPRQKNDSYFIRI